MDKDGNNRSHQIRKWLPIGGLVALTIALVIVFKASPNKIGHAVETGTASLLSYIDDLKPLIFKTEIKKEDVFDFAFNKNIPVDKEENKVLKVTRDNAQNEYIEIAPAFEANDRNYTYDKFLASIDADEQDKKAIDSILASYIKDLSSAILYDDKNTYAVNSNLVLLNKAILADIYGYLQSMNKERFKEIIPKKYTIKNTPALDSMTMAHAPGSPQEFIFLTQDTVFRKKLNVDYQETISEPKNSKKAELPRQLLLT